MTIFIGLDNFNNIVKEWIINPEDHEYLQPDNNLQLGISNNSTYLFFQSSYKLAPLPDVLPEAKLKAGIINVIHYNELIFELCDDNFIMETSEFETLSATINEEAASQALVLDIKVHQPCIAEFFDDKKWYRAQVCDLDELANGRVFVWFVDFGNFDFVARENIRVIKEEWLEFPLQQHIAKVEIQAMDKAFEHEALTFMEKFTTEIKMIEIHSRNPVSIKIFELEGSELSYQQLLDDGVVISS